MSDSPSKSPLMVANEAYLRLRKEQERSKSKLEGLEIQLQQCNLYIQAQEVGLKKPGLSDDEKSKIEAEIEKLKESAKDINAQAEQIKRIPDALNMMIDEMAQNPQMKKAINKHLTRGYNKKLKEAEEQKAKVTTLQNLIKAHPSIGSNIKGMLSAIERLKKLKAHLETLDPEKDQDIFETTNAAIIEVQNKFNRSRESVEQFLSKNDVGLDISDIDEITSHGCRLKGNNEVDVEKTLNAQLNEFDKKIAYYNYALAKTTHEQTQNAELGKTTPAFNFIKGNQLKGRKQEQVPEQGQTQNAELGETTPAFDVIHGNRLQGKKHTQTSNPNNLPADDIKWWQFGKRFRRWNENRKARAANKGKDMSGLDKMGNIPTEPETQQPENQQPETQQYRIKENIFDYDIVNDYVERQEREIIKQYKKNANKAVEKDEEER